MRPGLAGAAVRCAGHEAGHGDRADTAGCAARLPANHDDIAICSGIFDHHTEIGKRRQQHCALCFEFAWTEDVLAFHVPETIWSHDFINHCFTADVPNFFKPSDC